MVHATFVSFSTVLLGLSAVLAHRVVNEVLEDFSEDVEDDFIMLQRPAVPKNSTASPPPAPYLVPLRRESVPIYRQGKIASFKTSYSGVLTLGSPAQNFRVVFDTGSGHLVLPATECKSEACLVEGRRKFNMSGSSTSVAINSDGTQVRPGELCEQVTIGFGTGEIRGEFTKDLVCFGKELAGALALTGEEVAGDVVQQPAKAASELCVEMSVVLAVEMSTQPFKTFRFDGILGLGLDSLALSKEFSFFDALLGQGKAAAPQFGIFLTEGEHQEESEVAFGGFDPHRLMQPLSWVPVVMAEHGHWQVAIQAVRIDGETLDLCKDGTCRGVVDSGTSHLGVPGPFDKEWMDMLAVDAGDLLDCRLATAPVVEIELKGGMVLTLDAWNYMRMLPLREGVSVSSASGVYLDPKKVPGFGIDPEKPDTAVVQEAAAPSPPTLLEAAAPSPPTLLEAAAPSPPTLPDAAGKPEAAPQSPAVGAAAAVPASASAQEASQKMSCRPRLMQVKLPAPLGPKLFIMGEPVLHRYYTAYDWKTQSVGFGLANNRRNTMTPEDFAALKAGMVPQEVDMVLLQKDVSLTRSMPVTTRRTVDGEVQEETVFLQIKASVQVRMRVRSRTA